RELARQDSVSTAPPITGEAALEARTEVPGDSGEHVPFLEEGIATDLGDAEAPFKGQAPAEIFKLGVGLMQPAGVPREGDGRPGAGLTPSTRVSRNAASGVAPPPVVSSPSPSAPKLVAPQPSALASN